MRAWPAIAAAAVALAAAEESHASIPSPWCGTSPSAVDRQPDVTPGYAIHVAYVRSPEVADRFAAWSPRIVGDVAAIEAWWRAQDPARALRFDLSTFPCGTVFGQLDLSNIVLPEQLGSVDEIFDALRLLLAQNNGFIEPEKSYLVYYDGPTNQASTPNVVCGIGAARSGPLPGFAAIFLDTCRAEASDAVRPVVAVHELVHVLNAVAGSAPHACEDGHVCDVPNDVMAPFVSGDELETHVLDGNRDDYYGHAGPWTDVRDSLFLERLDSPDRAPPSAPGRVTATDGGAPGLVRLSWDRATDDVGPVTYRVYQDGLFVRSTTSTSALIGIGETETSTYAVRASDTVGHLSPTGSIRFRVGVGIVDGQGRLVRDTVKPPAIPRVTIRRTTATTRVTWAAVRDRGSPVRYRAKVGTRTIWLTRPALTLARARLRSGISLVVVDRAGNVGPATTVPLRLLR